MFDDNYGDMYEVISHIADNFDSDEYEFAAVVHGDVYLCKPVDPEDEDAYWELIAEVGPGQTGSWDTASDLASKGFPDGYELIDIMGGDGGRYLVYVNGD